MSEEEKDSFSDAYSLGGLDACRKLNELQKSGLHDLRIKLREKEITHEAIVELDEKIQKIESEIRKLLAKN